MEVIINDFDGNYVCLSYFGALKVHPHRKTVKKLGPQLSTLIKNYGDNLFLYRNYTYYSKEVAQEFGVIKHSPEVLLYFGLDYRNNFNDENEVVFFYAPTKSAEAEVESLLVEIEKLDCFKEEKKEPNRVSIILQTQGGLETKSCKLTPIEVDVKMNYNDGFEKADEIIQKTLSSPKEGLVILEGLPGTGKTSYIRYLTSKIQKSFIFIPSNMVENLSSPHFMNLLLDHTDSIFVLEDSESAVLKRDAGNASLVSTLLNLSDGILGNLFSSKFIITYNQNSSDVDPAILRGGRLKFRYEFKKLNKTKAQKKLDSLGIQQVAKEDMSLADIYNLEIDNNAGAVEKRAIGFGK